MAKSINKKKKKNNVAVRYLNTAIVEQAIIDYVAYKVALDKPGGPRSITTVINGMDAARWLQSPDAEWYSGLKINIKKELDERYQREGIKLYRAVCRKKK